LFGFDFGTESGFRGAGIAFEHLDAQVPVLAPMALTGNVHGGPSRVDMM
jgi:hypothetical protein